MCSTRTTTHEHFSDGSATTRRLGSATDIILFTAGVGYQGRKRRKEIRGGLPAQRNAPNNSIGNGKQTSHDRPSEARCSTKDYNEANRSRTAGSQTVDGRRCAFLRDEQWTAAVGLRFSRGCPTVAGPQAVHGYRRAGRNNAMKVIAAWVADEGGSIPVAVARLTPDAKGSPPRREPAFPLRYRQSGRNPAALGAPEKLRSLHARTQAGILCVRSAFTHSCARSFRAGMQASSLPGRRKRFLQYVVRTFAESDRART